MRLNVYSLNAKNLSNVIGYLSQYPFLDISGRDRVKNTLLMKSVIYQNEELFHVLLDKGVNFNLYNKDRNTALLLAIKNKESPKMAVSLIEKGADIFHKNKKGICALSESLIKENLVVTKEICFSCTTQDKINLLESRLSEWSKIQNKEIADKYIEIVKMKIKMNDEFISHDKKVKSIKI